MRNCYIWLILMAACHCNSEAPAASTEEQQNRDIVAKCLTETSGHITEQELRKVADFGNWTHEEVPCFTRCLVIEKGWFDGSQDKWQKQRLVDELGADMYNYCRFELDRSFENACDFAHKGLRCLKQAQLNIVITLSNVRDCAIQFNATNEQLQRYGLMPNVEEIPCLFQCFADKSHFYNSNLKWNYENWLNAFGPVKYETANALLCQASAEMIEQSNGNNCAWMYDEYLCLERLNYNSDGSVDRLPQIIATTAATIEKPIVDAMEIKEPLSEQKERIDNNLLLE